MAGIAAAFLLVGAAVAARTAIESVRAEVGTPRDLHGQPFAGSNTCLRCHERHHRSWARTFHRTMTQEVSESSVLGDFQGATLRYRGWSAHMFRNHDGAFRVQVRDARGQVHTDDHVVMTVGSRRIQQYLAERDGAVVRLPVAWHIEEGRWMHMNGAFLTPDPHAEDPQEGTDFDRHVVRWNDNCVFCHNVGANPGRRDPISPVGEPTFDTHVAELGIACEACHGPGARHVERNRYPWRRYALHHGDGADPTIVNPARLNAERSADVCGRCHGQRMTSDIAPFLQRGDPFVPGDDLALFSEPLWRDTEMQGEARFEERFWLDGTPRLTAYEYQGWLQSPCTVGGEMTCTTCHGMHEGDIHGQVRNDAVRDGHKGDGACVTCHAGSVDDGHDRHAGKVACVDCHMPRIVYGVIDVHRSHRISIPSANLAPTNAGELSQPPNACQLCHLDHGATALGTQWLFGGDPVERAVAADAWGRSEVVHERLARGMLLEAMRSDPYPAVRRIAHRALRRRDPSVAWSWYDPLTPLRVRNRAVYELRSDAVIPLATEVLRLRQRADRRAISIGE